MPTSSVYKGIVEVGEVKRPVGLAPVQGLGHSKVCEILVVIQNLNCVLGSLKDMSLLLKSAYD